MIFDPILRSNIDFIDVTQYDWVHTCLQDGLMNVEIVQFLNICKDKVGLQMKTVEQYMKGKFQFQRVLHMKSKRVYALFDCYHLGNAEATKLTALASEMISVYSVLRHFVETQIVEDESIRTQRESFHAACKIIDIMLLAKRGVMDLGTAAVSLRRAVTVHMDLFKVAYGTAYIKPKHHWMFDIADMMLRDTRKQNRHHTLVDAFVIERLHLRVRGPVEHIKKYE